jgi:Fe2+ transport system protein FeoA
VTGPATLADLPLGVEAVIVGYSNGAAARKRFVEMGLVPGSRVTRLRAAPFGDPSEYAVFGARLAVRRRDAAVVLVEVSDR